MNLLCFSLLLSGVCLGLAHQATESDARYHHRHRRHHRSHEHSLHPSFAGHKHHHSHHAHHRVIDDVCYAVRDGAFLLDTACGSGDATDLPLGTILTVLVQASQAPPVSCNNQKCLSLGVDCSAWVNVAIRGSISGGLQQGFVPESLVNLTSCGDAAPAPAVQPASALVSTLTLTANNPVEYPPMLPISGDGLCYYTPPYNPDGNEVIQRSFTLRDSPCGNTVLATIPPSTELTPLYVSQRVDTCSQVSKKTCADQRTIWLQSHANTADWDCSKPFTYNWWLKVQYGTKTGWVPNATVLKKRCADATLSVASCSLTPNTPFQCYRTPSRVALLDSPCGATTVATAPLGSIFISADGQPSQPCTSDATKKYFHVTFNGQDGYVKDTGLLAFGCNGDGFLTQVGPYPVLRIDHTAGDSTSANCPPNRACALQQNTPSKFLLHTTDGRWPAWGDYPSSELDSHAYWPHFLLGRNSTGFIILAQYFSMYSNSRALENNGGNDQGVVQVEIGARGEVPFTEFDRELTVAVRALYQSISNYTGIPICKDSRVNFIAGFGDASSYSGVQRLTQPVFAQVNGLVGHSTPYHNSHWDPGIIDPWKLID